MCLKLAKTSKFALISIKISANASLLRILLDNDPPSFKKRFLQAFKKSFLQVFRKTFLQVFKKMFLQVFNRKLFKFLEKDSFPSFMQKICWSWKKRIFDVFSKIIQEEGEWDWEWVDAKCDMLAGYFNSTLNPILYPFCIDDFKKALKVIIGSRLARLIWRRPVSPSMPSPSPLTSIRCTHKLAPSPSPILFLQAFCYCLWISTSSWFCLRSAFVSLNLQISGSNFEKLKLQKIALWFCWIKNEIGNENAKFERLAIGRKARLSISLGRFSQGYSRHVILQ